MSKIVADNISPRGSDVTIAGVGTFSSSGVNLTGVVTATSFVGDVTGNATGLSGSPTLSGITSVSTTNLTVNGNAYPNGGPLSNRNIVINGAMQVAQRGTSSTSSGVVTVDRFTSSWGGGAVTTTQESLTSGSPYNEGFRNYARLTNTTGATGASNYRELFYKIEAQDLANSGWNCASSSSYVTISFWIRSSVSQDYYFFLESRDGSNQIYSSPFTLSADTWTKVTKTIPGGASVQIDNDNGLGALFTFIAFYGTDFTDSGNTDETWRARDAADKFTLDMTNTWAGTTNATFDITGVQLEVGSVATPFEHRSFGDELARCQRYYQKSYDYETAPGTAVSQGTIQHGYTSMPASNYVARFGAQFRTSMRAQPTVVTYDTAGNSGKCNYPDTSTNQSFTIIHRGQNNFSAETSSLSNGTDARLYFHYTAEAEL